MGVVSKIFYFHVPSAIALFIAAFTCGGASIVYMIRRNPGADHVALAAAELSVVIGLIVMVTGPLWARKAWGVWWVWEPRLTSALLMELIFIAYLLVRKYGGPGSEKLAAATALFGTATAPFVYKSVDIWRVQHPKTTVVPLLLKGSMAGSELPFLVSALAFVLLAVVLMMLRVGLGERQAALDELYLAADEG